MNMRTVRALARRHLPDPVLRLARLARSRWLGAGRTYAARVAAESKVYAACEDVHDLPPIFHYWSNRYLRQKLESFGFGHPDAFFVRSLSAQQRVDGEGPRRFASLGAGNCDTEIRVASALRAGGCNDFVIDCIDLNADMLARGRRDADAAGLSTHIRTMCVDFNYWKPAGRYDAVMANQSLHHVLELERLFDKVHGALEGGGCFVVNDIIGRNGHLRWPEAKAIVERFWEELPPPYRYNRQLSRHETSFLDWDCSVDGFEGIRAQDILPLLVERFGFEEFIAFANVIDPFIDRSFGPNFDVANASDLAFIDRVHAADEQALAEGRIKPTHMFAVMRTAASASTRCLPGLSPAQSIRWPD